MKNNIMSYRPLSYIILLVSLLHSSALVRLLFAGHPFCGKIFQTRSHLTLVAGGAARCHGVRRCH